jgi:hypothetical protein
MIRAASSMNVKDARSGTLLVSMHFSEPDGAVDYLSAAELVCSCCGKRFSGKSTITVMNRGSWGEPMLPHPCEPTSAPDEQRVR